MIIREVKKKDFKEVKKLFLRNDLNFISKNSWDNQWRNPLLKRKHKFIFGWVYINKKKIIGHVGNYSTNYLFKKKKINCSVLHGWVVDQEFRNISLVLIKKYLNNKKNHFFLGSTFNKSAGNLLNSFGFAQVPEKGLLQSFLIFLNIENSLDIYFIKKKLFLKRLFFRRVIIFFSNYFLKFYLFKNINNWKKIHYKNKVKPLSTLGKNYSNFWDKYLKLNSNGLMLDRNKLYLEWILNLKKNNNSIKLFQCVRNNTLIGYSSCLYKKVGKFKYAILLDILSINDDQSIYEDLILANLKQAKKENCSFFEVRNFKLQKYKILSRFEPFKIKLPHNNFYYKSNDNKLSKYFNSQNFWNPCSLDGDILQSLN